MEKQCKTKSVDQNITEQKTLSCRIGEIEWQCLPRIIQIQGMGGIGKTPLIEITTDPKTLLCAARKLVTAAMTSSYSPRVVRIGPFHSADTNSLKNPLAVMESLSSNYKLVTVNDIARSAHVTVIETMFVEGYARHSFDELDCKNFASPYHHRRVSFKDDHLTGYMQKGSLENHLFKRYLASLPWSTRLKIAVEVAKGIAFLHGAKKPVIYRDFKTFNILLDSDYNAKLAEFGLAKDGPRGVDTHVSTRFMGTQGYAAPEYTNTGNMFSQLDNNELHRSHGNVPRNPEFHHDYTYKHSQPIRKDIVQYLSSLVVSIVVSLGIFYNIWSIQLSIFQIQPLHKEHNYRLSIWPSLLGLFGFMVFVCAVAVMNLLGAPFTSVQKAMLIFLAFLMHLQSANSIIELFVTLAGGLSMGWHAFGKKATTK